MPTSDFANVPAICNAVAEIQPKGVIELGVGCGKYGALVREVLDGTHGRVNPKDWQTTILGVEGFKDYSNPVWGAYTAVLIQDFTKHYEEIKGWDLVMMIDSLEHVEEIEARAILDYLVRNNNAVIISVPLGVCPQGAAFGNEFEVHRSTWVGEKDFAGYNYRRLHQGVCLVVLIKGVRE